MQWRGGEEGGGRVTYYDKEKKEEYAMKLPMGFTVLDELHTITGFSKKDLSGFWSNEVRDLGDELIVKTKAGTVARGKYGDIKDGINAKGAKYAKSVYIAFKDEEGELQIGNLKIYGAALTAWIEFQKRYDIGKVGVLITKTPKAEKNGTNDYFVPEFKPLELQKATLGAARVLDETLQSYLDTYLYRKTSNRDEDEIEEDEDEPEEKPAVKKAAKEDNDQKIDLSEIPF